jgi:hypothetical protein
MTTLNKKDHDMYEDGYYRNGVGYWEMKKMFANPQCKKDLIHDMMMRHLEEVDKLIDELSMADQNWFHFDRLRQRQKAELAELRKEK